MCDAESDAPGASSRLRPEETVNRGDRRVGLVSGSEVQSFLSEDTGLLRGGGRMRTQVFLTAGLPLLCRGRNDEQVVNSHSSTPKSVAPFNVFLNGFHNTLF